MLDNNMLNIIFLLNTKNVKHPIVLRYISYANNKKTTYLDN